ncbi:PHA/PHB synthase family protein [Stagnihabitans tardus]|uniref:Class I poly(R)-hydroxyalkanoic acid synthase n=1 Tax=Stagnihabitans tardus TaxID=2699202 RepID=A0AAE4YGP7_9RHOB|nr:class I poly(R)-hydroxyalkanoic acid synthase [Stagnihabitans tardus]NBZ89430.1 class I poly(R)-hydroxyalkanoic acid synthase [Stagnihabitans tardus]
MTTEEQDAATKVARLQENLSRVEALSSRLAAALSQRKPHDLALDGPSQEVFLKAAGAFMAGMMQNPAKLMEAQVGYWTKSLKQYAAVQEAALKGEPVADAPKDRRFSNPLWETNPAFAYIKAQYLLNAEAIQNSLADLEGLSDDDRSRAEFFTKQIVDMFAPTNFLGLNPDAMEKAMETDGASLVQGLENLVRDLEANRGEAQVTLADPAAFTVGVNIATTPGEVVFRNRMFELIQYTPVTDKVHKIPLLIFPPWINKFYVMDMKPANSLIRWIVEQGFTVFVVSWVNPDASYADVTMDDYIREGFMTAMAEVRRATGEKRINAVGYCIAGTTLGLTLAHLEKAGDKTVNAATFFTTLTDFSDPGEVGVFLANDFVDGIERQSLKDGILSRAYMSRTFSFLRSNDLIWQPAIKHYMMGEKPPAFDLLFWNGDGTNLPAKMAIEYLRGLCQDDGFAQGTFKVFGDPVKLSDVRVPLCAIACETDHIAHWKGSYNGVKQMGAKDKTFILSQSGHIAGIINPPSKGKYGHYTNEGPMGAPDDWRAGATFNQGSWWPRWRDWLADRSGPKVKARQPGTAELPVLCPAPGTYVTATPKV